ncbi:hypothetical protein [Streptomyces sp. NBC_00094]|uniref:hypothetical protein n=1 Tax=Streptomyces sp. NBC_00094 TaxID=2903620 RepID=UPI0022550ECE|nr:hypothetical protein [Streptomyces sp. NBC_00094]MCX5394033.1 hypothetical protein [Streptomyces sp. NBC_00094]
MRRHPTTYQSRVDTPRRIEERGGIGQGNDDGSGPWLWHAVIIAGQSAAAPIALGVGEGNELGVVEAVAADVLSGDLQPPARLRSKEARFAC